MGPLCISSLAKRPLGVPDKRGTGICSTSLLGSQQRRHESLTAAVGGQKVVRLCNGRRPWLRIREHQSGGGQSIPDIARAEGQLERLTQGLLGNIIVRIWNGHTLNHALVCQPLHGGVGEGRSFIPEGLSLCLPHAVWYPHPRVLLGMAATVACGALPAFNLLRAKRRVGPAMLHRDGLIGPTVRLPVFGRGWPWGANRPE